MSSGEFNTEPQIGQQRLEKLLQGLADKGLSQGQIAQRVGIPASYLTDVKKGHRAMTELFARRLAEEFCLDYRWLLGDAGTMDSLTLGQDVVAEESDSIWLPMFPHPVQGRPRTLPQWDGSCVEICGAGAARARAATDPYVLRFQRDDHTGRLRANDLVLVSQTVNDQAQIQVIKLRNKMFLARQLPDGSWERVAEKGPFRGDVPVVGHVIGIVWGSL